MKPRKILQKILTGSKNIRFDDFVTLIIAFGFTLDRISGSHHIFKHPSIPQSISIQPDKHRQAKDYQLKQFLRLIELFQLQLEDEE